MKRISCGVLPVLCVGVLLSGCGKESQAPVAISQAVPVLTVGSSSEAPGTLTPVSSVGSPAPAPPSPTLVTTAGLRVADEAEEDSPFLGLFKSPVLRGRHR